MLAIEVRSLRRAQEELRSVGAWPSIGHRENAGTRVVQLEVLIRELLTVDGLASRAVVVREVTTLAHKTWNDAVEDALLVTEALFPRAKSPKVLRRLGHHVAAEGHHDAPHILTTDGNLEEDARLLARLDEESIDLLLEDACDVGVQLFRAGVLLSESLPFFGRLVRERCPLLVCPLLKGLLVLRPEEPVLGLLSPTAILALEAWRRVHLGKLQQDDGATIVEANS